MKLYLLIILLLSIEYISSKCDGTEGSKLSECKDKLSEDEKKKYSNCCFAENKAGNKACIALTKDDYDKIDDYIKKLNDDLKGDNQVKKIDCNSLFLKFGFLNLLFFFL